MTRSIETYNTSTASQPEPLAYSALEDPGRPELRPRSEDELARSATSVAEGLEHYLRFQAQSDPLPEDKLVTLLDIMRIAEQQAAAEDYVPMQHMGALKELVAESVDQVASEDRKGEDGRTIEPVLIDAYLLERAASALEPFPEEQDQAIRACLKVVNKLHERDPGLVDTISTAIEKYTNQDEVPVDPEHPESYKTLDQTLRFVEGPQINKAMADYERRIEERDMLAGTIGTGTRRPSLSATPDTAALPTLEKPAHKKATVELGTAAYKVVRAEEKYGKVKIA